MNISRYGRELMTSHSMRDLFNICRFHYIGKWNYWLIYCGTIRIHEAIFCVCAIEAVIAIFVAFVTWLAVCTLTVLLFSPAGKALVPIAITVTEQLREH